MGNSNSCSFLKFTKCVEDSSHGDALLRLAFIRHGESTNNYYRERSLVPCYRRDTDSPLSTAGRIQCQCLGAVLDGAPLIDLHTVYASEMQRAVHSGLALIDTTRCQGDGPSLQIVPFFSEIRACSIAPPEDTKICYSDHIRDLEWPEAVWRHSETHLGRYRSSSQRFRTQVLPWIWSRRRDNTRHIPVVGHGSYLRRLLGLARKLSNTEVVLATYNLDTKQFQDVTRLRMAQRSASIPHELNASNPPSFCTRGGEHTYSFFMKPEEQDVSLHSI